jgi:type II secretory pathway component PulF
MSGMISGEETGSLGNILKTLGSFYGERLMRQLILWLFD